jgi:beta-RFAP synthase
MHSVEVLAPSRLHFGLLSFGQPTGRRFGGAGVMIDSPRLRLRLSTDDALSIHGPMAERVHRAVSRYFELRPEYAPPSCRIEVLEAPPQHVGLGSGTQLALAVVAALNALAGHYTLDAATLAMLSGRAERSAIGTYGFLHGGLLMESGKLPHEAISPLERRVELPTQWQFVLVTPRHERGISGDAERQAFEQLPPVPPDTTAALRTELTERLFPAAQRGDFAAFSESLYRYGHAAGLCFAAAQSGAFATPRVAQLVETIRSLGVRGVGQSSWGPTVFAAVENAAAGESFVGKLRNCLHADEEIMTVSVCNRGAIVR